MAYDPNKVNLGADLLTNPTASDRDPWQEAFKRFSAVPESKVLRASEALSGMIGSWAAQYQFGPAVTDNSGQPESTSPSNFSMKFNKLGRPGMPEIDFVPYSHNTNRFGNKGGALLGEPISFQPVGPTAKVGGQKMNWQWRVDYDNLVADHFVIYLDSIVLDTSVSPWVPTPRTLDVTDYYNIQSGDVGAVGSRFDGGLYLSVQESGYTDRIDPVGLLRGGVGDGAIIYDGAPVRNPARPLNSNSKTELFRIVDLYESGGNVLGFILDSSKPFTDYFDIGGDPSEPDIVRHIMLVEPAATRLVAIPGSGAGKGQEQVFAFTPPRRALTSENQMLYSDWAASGPVWPSEYPWDASITVPQDIFPYNYGPHLPIQRPYAEWSGVRLADGNVWATNGTWANMVVVWDADVALGDPVPEIEDVLKIHSVQTGDDDLWVTGNGRSAKWGSILGYFEVTGVSLLGGTTYYVTVRRYAEIDPETGNSMWGIGRMFSTPLVGPPYTTQLKCSIHKPVKELWDNPWFDADALDSTRLTCLIDPRWVERSGVVYGSSGVTSTQTQVERPLGKSPYRPDRAIFDTASSNGGADGSNANPGNLQNLGFRVVLFPAKIKTVPTYDGGTEDILAPDWDRPITSNEVMIDPTVNEKQYIEVDYANGFVRLSHPPQAVDVTDPTAGDLAPLEDIFTLGTNDNPRGEMVLFAACVPYTQDIGQLGAGPRVTANPAAASSTNACAGSANSAGSGEFYDVYGERVAFDVDTTSPQTITCRNLIGSYDQQLILTGLLGDQLPPNGFFELFQDGDPVLTTDKVRGSLFGYYGVVETGGNTVLHGVHGGLERNTDSVTFNTANPGQIVLRRELYTPNDLYGTATVLYQNDVTYGNAKRAGTLRFTGVDTVVNLDGSVTIQIQDTAVDAYDNLGDLFSSWVFEGGELTGYYDGGGPIYGVNIAETTIIYQGSRLVVPAGFLATAPAGFGYVYVDGSDCSYGLSSSIPLPDPELVLLGSYDGQGAGSAPETADLRYPLLDVDRRLDIFVGNRKDGTGAALTGPHFTTMAAAVAYANAIMNPTDSTGASTGVPDFRVRIRVVGYTTEFSGTVPIVIGCDGLTIESDPIIQDDASEDVAITWMGDEKALFDLNGHDDLTFEGLSLRSFAKATENTEPLRVAFTNTGGTCERLTINNCRLFGGQGFMAMIDNHLEDAVITNNYGVDLLDFGIYMTNTTEDAISMTAPTVTVTTTISLTSGEIYIAYGTELLTIGAASGGTITYTTGSPGTCTITDLDTMDTIVLPAEQATSVVCEGVGEFLYGAQALTFTDGDAGSISHIEGFPYSVDISVSSRILERSIIRNNTFIQAEEIGSMADNSRTMGADTATIEVFGGMTLRIGNDDTAAAIGAPPVLNGWIDIASGATATLTNDGLAAFDSVLIEDPAGPSILLQFGAGNMVALYASSSGTGGYATISFPGTDPPIIITENTFGYLRVNGANVDFIHGPNEGATAGGIVLHTDLPVISASAEWGLFFTSIMANMHNDIDHNTIRGFHVGIWSNVLWNSRVVNNFVSGTKNIGIYLGLYSGYYTANDNVLNNVFTAEQLSNEPFQWPAQNNLPPLAGSFVNPLTPVVKYGMIAGGLHSDVEANVISTASFLSTAGIETALKPSWFYQVYDLYMPSAWMNARANIVNWCIGGFGHALGIEDNTILSSGFASVSVNASIVVQALYSTIRGNSCGGNIYLSGSSFSIVDGNFARLINTANPNVSPAIGSENCIVSGNQVATGIYVSGSSGYGSSGCHVVGNYIPDMEVDIYSLDVQIIGNSFVPYFDSTPGNIYEIALTARGNRCVIANNRFSRILTESATGSDIIIGQISELVVVEGDNCVVQGNDIFIGYILGAVNGRIDFLGYNIGLSIRGNGALGKGRSCTVQGNTIKIVMWANTFHDAAGTHTITVDGNALGIWCDGLGEYTFTGAPFGVPTGPVITGNVIDVSYLLTTTTPDAGSIFRTGSHRGIYLESDSSHGVITGNSVSTNVIQMALVNGVCSYNAGGAGAQDSILVDGEKGTISGNFVNAIHYISAALSLATSNGDKMAISANNNDMVVGNNHATLGYAVAGGIPVTSGYRATIQIQGGQANGNFLDGNLMLDDLGGTPSIVITGNTMDSIEYQSGAGWVAGVGSGPLIVANRITGGAGTGWFTGAIPASTIDADHNIV